MRRFVSRYLLVLRGLPILDPTRPKRTESRKDHHDHHQERTPHRGSPRSECRAAGHDRMLRRLRSLRRRGGLDDRHGHPALARLRALVHRPGERLLRGCRRRRRDHQLHQRRGHDRGVRLRPRAGR
ncbi:hypothetical protein ACFPRL_09745 [Pseudoclavibacter helvolus]